MAKGQRKSNREIRKPKKVEARKANVSAPSLKGTPVPLPTKRA